MIKYKYEKDHETNEPKEYIYPTFTTVDNWRFDEGEEAEAKLCNAMAELAEKTGISKNDLSHLFPAVLRMMKSKSLWTE